MTPEQSLTDEARWFAQSLRALKDRDSPAETIQGRLALYRPRNGRSFQCPRCWVKDGMPSALRSAPGTDDYDVLRCNYGGCGAEFIVPF